MRVLIFLVLLLVLALLLVLSSQLACRFECEVCVPTYQDPIRPVRTVNEMGNYEFWYFPSATRKRGDGRQETHLVDPPSVR